MITKLFNAYIERQEFNSYWKIFLDLLLRLLSILLFPLIYSLLFLVDKVYPIRLGFLYRVRLGHFAMNTDVYLRRKYLKELPKTNDIFFVYKPTNNQLCRMFKRSMVLIESEIITKIFAPFGIFRTRFRIPLDMDSNEYRERQNCETQISFTVDEEKKGAEFLEKIGLGKNDWYVCIYARDNEFTLSLPGGKNWFSQATIRNADIETYLKAVEVITDLGGYVFRMGSIVEKKLNYENPKFIDYATLYRDDFLDVYLTAHAKFFIGTAGGATDLAILFDVPVLGVNYIQIGVSPPARNAIYIPKRIVNIVNQKDVPFGLQLSEFDKLLISAQTDINAHMKTLNWKIVDNTADEICEATKEMLIRLSGHFVEDEEYLIQLKKYRELFSPESKFEKIKTPIAKSFIGSLNLD
jgi:putative glycosyltransferase (TIGR04372 family)